LDGAASTLATIHVNLVMGTLLKYSRQQGVRDVLSKMERFEVNGQYCLTEIGHGLDAFSLETRADMTPEGRFMLNTPTPQAAK
jgi:acyl-CoA oxidase